MRPTILIVDDEPDMLELTTYQLGQAGFRVLATSSGCEALKQAQNHMPDVILLDLMLPDLDGQSVCELLQCLPSTRHIPVLILTAKDGDALPDLATRAGAWCLLRKPVDHLNLLTQLRRALRESTSAVQERQNRLDAPGTEPEANATATWAGAASEPPFSNCVLLPWRADP